MIIIGNIIHIIISQFLNMTNFKKIIFCLLFVFTVIKATNKTELSEDDFKLVEQDISIMSTILVLDFFTRMYENMGNVYILGLITLWNI